MNCPLRFAFYLYAAKLKLADLTVLLLRKTSASYYRTNFMRHITLCTQSIATAGLIPIRPQVLPSIRPG